MTYYNADFMRNMLEEHTTYRDKLYARGFFISGEKELDLQAYPFYGNWKKCALGDDLVIYYHHQTNVYVESGDARTMFLIGHAYDPFAMDYSEVSILKDLNQAMDLGSDSFWKKTNQLTGVFCMGYLESDGMLRFFNDCTGMQLVFQGVYRGKMMVTSHAKIAADLYDFEQSSYIRRLVASRFYHYWGTWLPGDLSPYEELKRVQPNFVYTWTPGEQNVRFTRFFPVKKIQTVENARVSETMDTIAHIMRNNLKLIACKWGDRAAISVTGGRDSTSTLASASEVYDKLQYFSYQSQDSESVDAEAAHQICGGLGLEHKIYTIPEEDSLWQDVEVFRAIMECNAGCIGSNNRNDVRKRLYFSDIDDFDVEVKSWVSELARGEAQNKYGTRRWPRKPSPGYYRCMWKVIADPILIMQSNRIFREYLKTYYDKRALKYLPWMDYFYWEFSWSGGEGTFLTAEHRTSYDITIPFNNRRLLQYVFSLPLDMRIEHEVPKGIIERNDKRVGEANVVVKNVAHTDLWTTIIRTYLRTFSKIGF